MNTVYIHHTKIKNVLILSLYLTIAGCGCLFPKGFSVMPEHGDITKNEYKELPYIKRLLIIYRSTDNDKSTAGKSIYEAEIEAFVSRLENEGRFETEVDIVPFMSAKKLKKYAVDKGEELNCDGVLLIKERIQRTGKIGSFMQMLFKGSAKVPAVISAEIIYIKTGGIVWSKRQKITYHIGRKGTDGLSSKAIVQMFDRAARLITDPIIETFPAEDVKKPQYNLQEIQEYTDTAKDKYLPEPDRIIKLPEEDVYETIIHIVQTGDTLGKIAKQYTHDVNNWRAIMQYNNIANPSIIHAGEEIHIPGDIITLKYNKQHIDVRAKGISNVSKSKTDTSKSLIRIGQYTVTAKENTPDSSWVIVQTDYTDIMSAPDPLSSTLKSVNKGTRLEKAGIDGEWIKVKISKEEGYVYKDDVK